MLPSDLKAEAERQLIVCNACRYCEGFCAVFPAMEFRRAFTMGDITYLAHLCHDCRGCYYACMYAPPHEFAINIPQIMSKVRLSTYESYTWPDSMRRLWDPKKAATILSGVVLAVIGLCVGVAGPNLFMLQTGAGAFYRVIPHWAMLTLGLGLGFYWVAVWAVAGVRFWRDANGSLIQVRGRDFVSGFWDALRMRWLEGGGDGCPYPDERPSQSRRIFHSLVFYGFASAFASTTSAAVYQELLGELPPYPVLSIPVVLGSLGGIAMLVGCGGLWVLKLRSDRDPLARQALAGDYLFYFLLIMVNGTGILTLLLRETRLMGPVLAAHLGFVAALYVGAAHGKFVHVVYRMLALIRNRAERRGPIVARSTQELGPRF